MLRSLFITRAGTVSVYSVNTGEWNHDLANSTDATIVNIQNIPDEPTMLFGCTEDGDIIKWKHKSGTVDTVVVSVLQYKFQFFSLE